MKRTNLLSSIVLLGAFAVLLSGGRAHAQDGFQFTVWSPQHLEYGVSQMWAGQTRDRSVDLRFSNPVGVEQAALAFIYERTTDAGGGEGDASGEEAEVFDGCTLRRLTPHSSLSISFGNPTRYYAEVISAPVQPVTVNARDSRKANGLGILVRGGGSNEVGGMHPVHPSLFTLPSSLAVPGQREVARQCACSAIVDAGLRPNIFLGFGIDCSDAPVL